MSRAFHHGICFYGLRNSSYYPASNRPGMAPPPGQIPRILRQLHHRFMGLCQHLHRTPLGNRMGEERSPAHEHGHHMVVCGPARDFPREGKRSRGHTTEEPHPRNGYPDYRVGHGRTSPKPRTLHPCTLYIWIYTHGRGRGTDHRNRVCASGSKFLDPGN